MKNKIPKCSYIEEEVNNIWNIYWLTFSTEIKAINLYLIIVKTLGNYKSKNISHNTI